MCYGSKHISYGNPKTCAGSLFCDTAPGVAAPFPFTCWKCCLIMHAAFRTSMFSLLASSQTAVHSWVKATMVRPPWISNGFADITRFPRFQPCIRAVRTFCDSKFQRIMLSVASTLFSNVHAYSSAHITTIDRRNSVSIP